VYEPCLTALVCAVDFVSSELWRFSVRLCRVRQPQSQALGLRQRHLRFSGQVSPSVCVCLCVCVCVCLFVYVAVMEQEVGHASGRLRSPGLGVCLWLCVCVCVC